VTASPRESSISRLAFFGPGDDDPYEQEPVLVGKFRRLAHVILRTATERRKTGRPAYADHGETEIGRGERI
jgi:hypothetical protein